MPLRGLAKAKNFTLGPTAPLKTFTENIHTQTKKSNDLGNSGKSHKLTNIIQNENLYRYESKIKSDFDEIVPTLKEIARIQHHCLLYTSPSPRDSRKSRMPSSA